MRYIFFKGNANAVQLYYFIKTFSFFKRLFDFYNENCSIYWNRTSSLPSSLDTLFC